MEVIKREPDEEVDEVAVLAVRDLLKSFHQAIGKTKSAVLWPNSHLREMASSPFCTSSSNA